MVELRVGKVPDPILAGQATAFILSNLGAGHTLAEIIKAFNMRMSQLVVERKDAEAAAEFVHCHNRNLGFLEANGFRKVPIIGGNNASHKV